MLREIIRDELRLLTFRGVSPAVYQQWKSYLAFGLICTWLAGIGRYWDNPRAEVWQHAGTGSLLYVFTLALLIWLLVAPLRPANWSYRNVLLFVTLTSPPALLYAIPVERFMSANAAMSMNAWFLGVVAVWRVALYAVFLARAGRLSMSALFVATLLPVALIVTALTFFNLEHVVFNLMGGIAPEDRSPHDAAYGVVFVLATFSIIASPILLISYIVLICRAWRRRHSARHEMP